MFWTICGNYFFGLGPLKNRTPGGSIRGNTVLDFGPKSNSSIKSKLIHTARTLSTPPAPPTAGTLSLFSSFFDFGAILIL